MVRQTQWEQLQNNSDRLLAVQGQRHCPQWKIELQDIIDETVRQYVSLPAYKQTGLQCFRLFGKLYQTSALKRPNKELQETLPNVIQRLLESLCHVTWNKRSKKELHLYVLDESIPIVNDLYNLYLQQSDDHDSTFKWDRVVMHFLLENKQMVLGNRDSLTS